jgi:chaperone required for assembly of F1-ATPase
VYKSIYIGGFPPIHSSQPREAMTQMSQAAAELQDSFAPQRLATLRRLVATWNWPFVVDFPMKNGDFPMKNGDFP